MQQVTDLRKGPGVSPPAKSMVAAGATDRQSPVSRLLGKSALQKAKCTNARHPYSGMTTHKALDRLSNSAASHRLAKMTWRLSAGKEYAGGRRYRSPKSGVETWAKVRYRQVCEQCPKAQTCENDFSVSPPAKSMVAGRRDRSPKSGVETLGKSALQKAKCTNARHLYSGMTTHKA